MKVYIKRLIVIFCLCSIVGYADTFKHKESGEVFTGFATQKVTAGKTLVYNADESKMTRVVLSNYEVTSDGKGRRNTVSLLLIDQSEVLLSDAVSKKVAAAIIATSNKGPQAIILQINGPGGRGEYMKTITDAISQTTCPVIAFISEGAYSAAAVTATACDKVYMKSTAGIGAVGMSGQDQSYAEHLSIYNSDSLLTHSPYVTALAQEHNRPELLVKALIDKRISIIEVANIDGSRMFVGNEDRQPTQTLIRTLCEGTSVTEADSVSPADVVGKVLNLTAKDAVELGLADGTAESTAEVLAAMQLSDTKIAPVPGIEKEIKKYNAARRNIAEGLFRIEQFEQDVEKLTEQFSTIDEQLRTATQTREVGREDPGYRSQRNREQFPADYDSYYERDRDRDGNTVPRRQLRTVDRDRYSRSQRITTEEPRVNIEIVYEQLTIALEDLVAEYRRMLRLVDRWPGGLPPKLTKTMIQNNKDSAAAELDRLYRYSPVYPTQDQPQAPRRRSEERRRY